MTRSALTGSLHPGLGGAKATSPGLSPGSIELMILVRFPLLMSLSHGGAGTPG